jgi:hypothetical protein
MWLQRPVLFGANFDGGRELSHCVLPVFGVPLQSKGREAPGECSLEGADRVRSGGGKP